MGGSLARAVLKNPVNEAESLWGLDLPVGFRLLAIATERLIFEGCSKNLYV